VPSGQAFAETTMLLQTAAKERQIKGKRGGGSV